MKFLRLLFLSACSLFAVAASWADELVVIDLQHRSVDELLPVLRPLAGQSSLSGTDYKLLVRGDTTDIARVREAVAVLDKAPRQLRISVRYRGLNSGQHSDAGVTVSKGGRASIGTSLATTEDASVSSIRVLEGDSALIAVGGTVPVVAGAISTRRRTGNLNGALIEYQEVNSGFAVTPRINGDRVLLDIETQRADAASSEIATRRAATTVSMRLGEWFEIGGIDSAEQQQRSSVDLRGATRRTSTESDARTVEVKVELSP